MSREKTLKEFLADFAPKKARSKDKPRPVTFWLPADEKARYDKLQESSQREFGKKAREALLALIDAAEAAIAS